MELTDFLHAGTNSCKLKGASKFLAWEWSKMCVASLVMGLILTVSKIWTDGITNFLHVDTDSQKWKPDQKFFGWAWLKMGVGSLVMGL